jgi:hypothetical protein
VVSLEKTAFMSPVSQYVVLIICGLGMLGLTLRILGKRRGRVLLKASLQGNSLGICIFGLIFCRTVWCMIQPAVLHRQMGFWMGCAAFMPVFAVLVRGVVC